jgi:hypothetical protein
MIIKSIGNFYPLEEKKKSEYEPVRTKFIRAEASAKGDIMS